MKRTMNCVSSNVSIYFSMFFSVLRTYNLHCKFFFNEKIQQSRFKKMETIKNILAWKLFIEKQ